jgi:hypothetical protein
MNIDPNALLALWKMDEVFAFIERVSFTLKISASRVKVIGNNLSSAERIMID